MPQEYVASFNAAKGTELLHYGVRGMRWGVRNSPSSSGGGGGGNSTVKVGRIVAHPRSTSGKGEVVTLHPQPHVLPLHHPPVNESSIQRYARLRTQVKLIGPHHLSDDDLKFFNARAEALTKAKKVVQNPQSRIHKAINEALDAALKKVLSKSTDALLANLSVGKTKPKGLKMHSSATSSMMKQNPAFAATTLKNPRVPIFKVTTL